MIMLDINFIRQNPEVVKKAVQDKRLEVDIDKLLKIDEQRRSLLAQVEDLRRQKNLAAKEQNIEEGKKVKNRLNTLEEELKGVEERFNHLILYVPNIPQTSSLIGDETVNKEVFKWGEIPQFDFPVRDHLELGKMLDILDLEAGTKIAGFRGYYLKNEGAILHWALLNFAFDKIISHGFAPMVPPTLLYGKALIGSGHFPFGKDEVYQIANPGKLASGEDIKNPLYLAGTSEPSLLAYYIDKTLSWEELPVTVCAMTQCYRSEVGSYGKDVKGLFRVHEFGKVEQVVICKNNLEESEEWFKKMQAVSEEILKDLGIPYRIMQISTGDMGAGKYRMDDIEAWMPGRGKYGETHSNSNLTDWQARRLNLKFKNKEGQTHYCYTLNNTVLTSPRILIAILENCQQQDGSVKIPEVLHPYTKFPGIKLK